jgi:catechol 2,3-dioxygenase-like lactoylglutathione lyase family enzyme
MGDFRFLYATDRYDECRRFYGEVLGWPVVTSWDDDGRGTVFRAGGDGCVEVAEAPPGSPGPSGVSIAVEVPDVDSLHADLARQGVTASQALADQRWGHRSVGVVDPAGVPVVFFTVAGRGPLGEEGIDGLD